jgi:glycosyltransferase involved in cell wall biosynthesis
MPTILHISTRLILGGSQENTVLSCEGQARLGHDVHLAYGPIYGPEGSLLDRVKAFRTLDAREIHCHEIPHMFREIKPIADLRCYRELHALIREIRPDVIHTHSSKAGVIGRSAGWAEVAAYTKQLERSRALAAERQATQLDAEAAAAGQADLSSSPSDSRDDSPTGGAISRWPDGPPAIVHTIHGPPFHEYLSSRKNTLYVRAERYAAERTHVIVSVADAMTDQFLANGIGKPELYETVYSGMEVDKFLTPREGEDRESIRAELGFTDRDYVVGTVARLAELKGHDDVIDALSPEIRTRRNWKLLWVGDGWWRDRLLDRVHTLGLRNNVVTTGLVPQDRVPAMIRAMDVLVHPSCREGLPRTVPQALLCAVPVVASDTDGTPEVCRNEQTGLLFPVGDAPALRKAVVWMHDHPEEARAMTERGRELCRDMFCAERMVAQLERVYQRALALARADVA